MLTAPEKREHGLGLQIIPAESTAHLDLVRELLLEYWQNRNLALYVFDFDKELAGLPGDYAPPDGRLFLAHWNDEAAGCVALRKIGPDICEMKRLYVRPGFRGTGLGHTLAEAIILAAREIGYQRMRLDTLPGKMDRAIAMYRSLGFKEIGPYYDNPVESALFMELEL